jgi:formylglycine-generating enzyme
VDANPHQGVPYFDADWTKPYNWDRRRRAFPADKGDHPVVLVSWHDAQAFCDWAGLILPSEQHWEKAARGTDGRIFPWGDEWVNGRCNTSEDSIGGTTPVGKYSPVGDSPYGCADMAGNAWEWTGSWVDDSKGGRVLRGGSWDVSQRTARMTFRLSGTPDFAYNGFGFRAAAPVDPES